MAVISSLGIGSGLDIGGLVRELVSAERQPVQQRLDRREARLQGQLSALGSIKSALSTFQSGLQSLRSAAQLQPAAATSSNAEAVRATALPSAAAGSYELEVLHLARAQRLASGNFAETTSPVGTGTLTFRFGTHDADAATFEPNDERPGASVTIGAGDNSLQGIRDAVNRAGIGVRASLVDDGDGFRLVFSVTDTGAANTLKIEARDAQGNPLGDGATGLAQLAYDPLDEVAGGMQQTVSARDAQFTVDGLAMRRASNTVAGAIPGVTLQLLAEGSSTIGVSRDDGATVNAVKGFVERYNALATTLNELTHYDPSSGAAGIMLGDATVRNIQSQMRGILSTTLGASDAGVRALADLGIATRSDGTLSVNEQRLSERVADHPDDVAALFAAVGKSSDALVSYLGSSSATQPGTYGVDVTQLATRGQYTGGLALSFDVGAMNDSLKLTVNGVSSGTIKITQGTYASGAALAAELQSRINADAALKAASATVTVAYEDGRFVIRSERYGSNSTVRIDAAQGMGTTLGIGTGVGSAEAGVDVQGTLGGLPAVGSGQTLTGTGSAQDLRVRVEGELLGARGAVSFTRGVADRMFALLERYTAADAMLDERSSSLNGQVRDVERQREQLAVRMEQIERRYLAQFTAMDAMVAQLQSTGNFLAQQLDQLANMQSYQRRR